MASKLLFHMACVIALISSVQGYGQQLSNLTLIGNDIGTKTLNTREACDIFKAKSNMWSNKKTVVICLPETKSQDAVEVYSKVYGKTVPEVQKFWLSLVFQGRSRAPHFFDTDQEMLDFIQKTPGAIGVFINDKHIAVPDVLSLQITP